MLFLLSQCTPHQFLPLADISERYSTYFAPDLRAPEFCSLSQVWSLFTNLHMDVRPGRVQIRTFLVSSLIFSEVRSGRRVGGELNWGLSSRGLSVGPGYRLSPLAEELRVRESCGAQQEPQCPKRPHPCIESV